MNTKGLPTTERIPSAQWLPSGTFPGYVRAVFTTRRFFGSRSARDRNLTENGAKPGVCMGRNTAFSTTSGNGLNCKAE